MSEDHKNEERAFDFLKLAFSDARGEIISRLAMREKIVEVYLVSSISLMGVLLVAARLIPELPVFVYIVAPILSMSMSMLIRSHYIAMEKLSEFIRYDLNQELISLGGWSPYWDYFNRKGDTGIGTSLDKTRARWLAHAVSMHAPSAISMCFFFYFAFEVENSNLEWTEVICTFDAFTFYVAVVIFAYALWCTFCTLTVRKDARVPSVPTWYS
ncbi:hypothetical protein KUV64_22140 [Mameliella alba]|uniref:hypothetical protein n=1 Tax=Mameliella alba TaxID=561184 RepID=UPI001C96D9B9|nr:hypothetical protein [Mameliella alba]MBY6121839.1 hypothetical protein [Mameliella alba]